MSAAPSRPTSAAGSGTAVRLCGPLLVRIAGRRLDAQLPSRQGRLVLAYLVLRRPRRVGRDELVEALWPEGPPDTADATLTSLLSRLRRALGADVLQGRRELWLELGMDPWVDVEVAERAPAGARERLAAGDPAGALQVAREGLEIVGAPLLAELDRPWISERRRALEDVGIALLELVARVGAMSSGEELVTAEAAARALVAREPLRESAYALLMEILSSRGDVAAALTVYDRLRRTLREELGTVPSAPVRALNERLLQPGREPHAPHAGLPRGLPRPAGLVGREREREQALQAIRAADRPRLVLLTGEPGIGKTALAGVVARQALPARVLYGRCDAEPMQPFQPFAEAARDVLERIPALRERVEIDELARLLPELGPVPAGGDRHRLFETIVTLLAAVGPRVLLVIDDLHWADGPTLTMLRYLLRRPTDAVVVLGTARDASAGLLGQLIADLRREGAVTAIALGGLDAQAIERLIAERTQAPPRADLVDLLHGRTGGNPFFIEQLLNAGSPQSVPEAVGELIARRVDTLPAAGEASLRVGSALGAEFTLTQLERVLGEREPIVAGLEAALAAQLVVEVDAGRFAFAHVLARDAVYAAMSATRRASLHQRIGEALEGLAPPAALAHHYGLARGVGGAERAVHWALIAAEHAAAALAGEQETAQYEAALRALDDSGSADDATRCRVLLALADRRVTLGGDYRAPCLRAAEIARRQGWSEPLAEAACTMTRVLGYGHADRDGKALLEEALRALGDQDSVLRVRVLGGLAHSLAVEAREPEQRERLTRAALDMARRLGDPTGLVAAIGARCETIAGPDRVREQLALLEDALAVVSGTDRRLNLQRDRVVVLESIDPQRAARELDRLEEVVLEQRLGEGYMGAEVARLRAARAISQGRLEHAERLAEDAHRRALQTGDPDATAHHTAQVLAVRLAQGRAGVLAATIAALAGRSPAHAVWRAASCLLHARGGDLQQARRDLATLTADRCAAIPHNDEWLAALVMLADAAADLGDAAAAATLTRLLAPYGDRLAVLSDGSAPLGVVSRALDRLGTLSSRA